MAPVLEQIELPAELAYPGLGSFEERRIGGGAKMAPQNIEKSQKTPGMGAPR
ncbi:MAG: hypothetical protein WAK41_20330 [Roseiarcus sp.]